jgi:hypothetical protein
LSNQAKAVEVIHHTGAHGRRYEVDKSHGYLLKKLVENGRKKIRKWMMVNNVSEVEMHRFDRDVYKKGFNYSDIPILSLKN